VAEWCDSKSGAGGLSRERARIGLKSLEIALLATEKADEYN
jgi:hypothetical protein